MSSSRIPVTRFFSATVLAALVLATRASAGPTPSTASPDSVVVAAPATSAAGVIAGSVPCVVKIG